MGRYTASIGNFSDRAIIYIDSIIQDGKGLPATVNTGAGFTPSLPPTICQPSGGTLKSSLVQAGLNFDRIYSFTISTNSSGNTLKVNAVVKDPSKAALYNKSIDGLTIAFNTAALVAGLGEPGGAGTASGEIQITLGSNDVRYPDSTIFWNNQAVSICASNKDGNVVGVLAGMDHQINVEYEAYNTLPLVWKSIDTSQTSLKSPILML
tara:strand:- start:48 stop:671 length:624 start_codon:yes stop_codon:yes gene_type:complete